MELPGGGGDDKVGKTGCSVAACLSLQGGRGFTGISRPDRASQGSGVPPLLCPADDYLSAVEVGSSCSYEVAAGRLGNVVCLRP
jgi:hypothetical protein